MDFITKNPGLQHIVEETFMNLDYENLLKCQEVNSFWEIILKSPSFWLKKCVQKGLNNEDQLEWHKLIQTLKTTNFNPEKVTSHLKEIHENFEFDDIELYLKFSLYICVGVAGFPAAPLFDGLAVVRVAFN